MKNNKVVVLLNTPSSGLRPPSPSRGEGNKVEALNRNAFRAPLRSGFTLIELLVVVLIIGVLAAVALPQYNKAVKKAQAAEVLNAIDAMDKALASYYLTHGEYAGIIHSDDLDVEMPVLKYWQYENLSEPDSGTFFQIGCNGDGTVMFGNFVSNPSGLFVESDWSQGRQIHIYCQEQSGANGRKCTDYFNCEWQDVPWAPCKTCDPVRVDTNCYIK